MRELQSIFSLGLLTGAGVNPFGAGHSELKKGVGLQENVARISLEPATEHRVGNGL
jgi:hypothetical protein